MNARGGDPAREKILGREQVCHQGGSRQESEDAGGPDSRGLPAETSRERRPRDSREDEKREIEDLRSEQRFSFRRRSPGEREEDRVGRGAAGVGHAGAGLVPSRRRQMLRDLEVSEEVGHGARRDRQDRPNAEEDARRENRSEPDRVAW